MQKQNNVGVYLITIVKLTLNFNCLYMYTFIVLIQVLFLSWVFSDVLSA